MHIKKKSKINRQRTYNRMALQAEYGVPRPQSAAVAKNDKYNFS